MSQSKSEKFWGRIDPFLAGLLIIMISAWYALPRYLDDYLLVQTAFYAAAAFLILFDAYARGLYTMPKFLTRGPLVSVLIAISGIVAFVVLFLSTPYLFTALLEDFLKMFGRILNHAETDWVIMALGIVSSLYFVVFLNKTISTNFEEATSSPARPAMEAKPVAGQKPKAKAKRRK